MADIFCLFDIIRPDMTRDYLLTAPAFCTYVSGRTILTLVTQTFVFPISFPVCRAVRQTLIFRTDDDIQIFIIDIFIPFMESGFGHRSFIRQRREPPIVYHTFTYPRRFISSVHRNDLYFRKTLCNFLIQCVKRHAVMNISAGNHRIQYKVMPVAYRMGLIGKTPLMFPFMENPALRIRCGNRDFFFLFSVSETAVK